MSKAVQVFKHFETPKKNGVYYRLVCLTGDDKGSAYFLMGNRIVMGRSDKCDITILDLKSSREHAEIILVGKDYILTDLGSQNGIIINDLKVKQHALTDGDKIIVGKTVYKFSRVEVKEEKTASKKVKRKKVEKEEETEEEEPKNKKMVVTLAVLAVLGLLLIAEEESGEVKKKKSDAVKGRIKEIDDSFARAIKQRSKDSRENKEKLKYYFDRGLREYREGNYFRAISEFENAQQWSPNDSNANFYLRKTREKLDEQIESYFSKAIRDVDAINYQKAVISYCAILRLLNQYPNDERYISAKEAISNMEKKMGLEEGDIVCVEKTGGKK